MASKYAHLKGHVPEEQTVRDVALVKALEEREKLTLDELTKQYNDLEVEAEQLAVKVKDVNVRWEACEILIRGGLAQFNADAIRLHGYTWSEGCEPYPVCEDPRVVEKYFRENGMEDQLLLKTTELASRLKNFVKNESMNNELTSEEKQFVDPVTGEERTIIEVRSKIPCVRVFLKKSLSRRKSGNSIKGVVNDE